ncbi:unnamed protein product [Durusdinium trenchii]|uniref:Uncharacterized protein n=2 Tax=Durusdinium trenchii TaxID=1381693 RepID=A0ABP0LZY4_9DINO
MGAAWHVSSILILRQHFSSELSRTRRSGLARPESAKEDLSSLYSYHVPVMPNSVALPRGIVTACRARAARCLLMSCLTWALSSNTLLLDSFCGSHEVQARRAELRTTMKVRERLGSLSRPKSKNQKPDDLKDEVRQLNSRLKQAGSEAELIGILEEKVDAPFFDPIHASTAFHKLATFKQTEGSLPICAVNPAFLRLNARMKDFLKQNQVKSWASANLLWAIAILGNELSIVVSLLPNLVKSFGARASGMTEQELSNCLLSAARLKLKGVAPEEGMNIAAVLADRIPGKADGMNPQELSNCLWASAYLIDVAPHAVAKIAPSICDQIPGKVSDMIPQHLSNCLWAAVQLKDVARDDAVKIVPALASRIPGKAAGMNPQEFSNCLWAAARLKDVAPDDVRKIVSALAGQIGVDDVVNGQDLSNNLWASAQLQNLAPDDVLKLVQASVAHIASIADSMNPQHLSSSLFAAGQLKDLAQDDAARILTSVAVQLPGKAGVMSPQEIANSLQGLVLLQDVPKQEYSKEVSASRDAFVQLAAHCISDMTPTLRGKDLALTVPACSRFGLPSQPLLRAVARRFGSSAELSSSQLPDWDLCALTWSYQMLDATGQFIDFQKALRVEIERRGLSESDVERSKDGHYEGFAGDK